MSSVSQSTSDFHNVTNASPVQYHHLYTASSVQSSPVSLSLRYEFSPASSDFTATHTNSYSTLSSTTLESEGESPSKILSKTRIKNWLDQPSQLRISHQTSTISKITAKTQLTTFAPLDSINHQAIFTWANHKGISKFQFDFQFHDAYSFFNLIVNKHTYYQ